jgi:hypothetical protein
VTLQRAQFNAGHSLRLFVADLGDHKASAVQIDGPQENMPISRTERQTIPQNRP